MREDVALAASGLLDLAMGRDTIEAEGSAFLLMECVRVLTGAHGKR
jgi:hypothetical protein